MIHLIQDRWTDIIYFMRNEYDITSVSFKTWIEPLKPVMYFNDTLIVSVPYSRDNIMLDYVTKRYTLYLQVSIEEVTSISCNVKFQKESKDGSLIKGNNFGAAEDNSVNVSSSRNNNLNPKYTFDTFVVGANNKFAHAASLAVAESPAERYNPLFIYGGVGLGKTHLMHSIAHFILKNNPSAKVLYVTSENFTNELIDAIRNKNNVAIQDFKEKYRNIDVLLIDDVQFIIGKESTQEEFFHTFNYLHENGKQIVLSSDNPPKALAILDERLRSRFEMGLSVDISAPDYETRMAILRKKEEMEGYNIDNEILSYIASNIISNIRELEGALTKITAYSKLYNSQITLEVAKEALKDLITPDAKREVTLELIINIVAEHFGFTPEEILSTKRNKEIVYPRHIVMYLGRKMTSSSLQQIGTALNKKDHTTILHGCKQIETELQSSESLRSTIDVLMKKISPT